MRMILPFLEDRAYMHGTTLYDELLERFQPCGKHTFKVVKPIFSNCVQAFFSKDEIPASASINAVLSWTISDSEAREVFLAAREAAPPIKREAFDERGICRRACFYDKKVAIAAIPAGESFVRVVVALNKELLNRETSFGSDGQWLFTCMDSFKDPNYTSDICLEIADSRGKSFVASEIRSGSDSVGVVYFYWSSYKIQRAVG